MGTNDNSDTKTPGYGVTKEGDRLFDGLRYREVLYVDEFGVLLLNPATLSTAESRSLLDWTGVELAGLCYRPEPKFSVISVYDTGAVVTHNSLEEAEEERGRPGFMYTLVIRFSDGTVTKFGRSGMVVDEMPSEPPQGTKQFRSSARYVVKAVERLQAGSPMLSYSRTQYILRQHMRFINSVVDDLIDPPEDEDDE